MQQSWQFFPKKIVELALTERPESIPLAPYRHLYGLVRHLGQPLGWVDLPNIEQPNIDTRVLEKAIYAQLSTPLLTELEFAEMPEFQSSPDNNDELLPAITVIVCTRNRTHNLRHCLEALLQLEYLRYEILVVDNAPSDSQTASLIAQFVDEQRIRYVCEERVGLDWARNRGIAEAQHEILAFTDDDARPDKGWLRAIAQALSDPTVSIVTGPVLPAELETNAQTLFELAYGGMSHGFTKRLIQRKDLETSKLLWASGFGVGANMAFRKQIFDFIGFFDVALDVGTPSGGGGDIEIFHRAVAKGYALLYTPTALVWHQHRRNLNDLARQLFDNGRGFGSYLWTCVRNRTVSPAAIFYFALRHWLWPWLLYRLIQPNGFPRALVWAELQGALYSPFAYQKAQKMAKQHIG